jgi:hypothetical protein
MYLGNLGGPYNATNPTPTFFRCDGKVDGTDMALFLICFHGQGPNATINSTKATVVNGLLANPTPDFPSITVMLSFMLLIMLSAVILRIKDRPTPKATNSFLYYSEA